MKPDLATHFTARGLVNAHQSEQARALARDSQVSFDTALLQLALLDEPRLTQALAEFHHLPPASKSLLDRLDPRMSNLFPLELATKHHIVPICVSGRSVHLACSTRPDPVVLKEIGFMLSLKVSCHVVCWARLLILLRDSYRIKVPVQFADLLARLGQYQDPLPLADLPAPTAPAPAALATTAPQPKPSATTPGTRRSLTRQEATRLIDEAEDRDQAIEITLQYALQFVPYAAFFTTNQEEIVGKGAMGETAAQERILKLRLSAGVSSILGMVLSTRAFYLGPVPDSVGNNQIFQIMHRRRPTNALVIPIQLQDRVIAILYGDAGKANVRSNQIGDLLLYCSHLTTVFEGLIKKRKKGVKKQEAKAKPRVPAPKPAPKPAPMPAPKPAPMPVPKPVPKPAPAQAPKPPAAKKQPAPVPAKEPAPVPRVIIPDPPPMTPAHRAAPPPKAPSLPAPAQPPKKTEAPRTPNLPQAPRFPELEQTLASDPGIELESAMPEPEIDPSPSLEISAAFSADPSSALPEVDLDEAQAAGFLDDTSRPVVAGNTLGIADAEKRALEFVQPREDEERVRFEDLGAEEEAVIALVDADSEVVIVTSESSFTPSGIAESPGLTPLKALDQAPESIAAAPAPGPFLSAPLPVPVEEPLGFEAPQSWAPPATPDMAPQEPLPEPSSEFMASLAVPPKSGLPLQDPEPSPAPRPSETDPRLSLQQAELIALSIKLVRGNPEERKQAASDLLRIGPQAADAILPHFPGTLTHDIYAAPSQAHNFPPLSQHSELLRVLLQWSSQVNQDIVEKLGISDARIRLYAVRWFGEVRLEEAVPLIARRLYDPDGRVRLAAVDVLLTYQGTPEYEAMLQVIRSQFGTNDPEQQAIASALAGNFKDPRSVPGLIGQVTASDPMVSRASLESLVYITKQDFGTQSKKWLKWYKANQNKPRTLWLIEGLAAVDANIRYASALELEDKTGENHGYVYDAARRFREAAIKRWQRWWKDTGRHLE